MSERFFVPRPIVGDRALLTDAEAHHLIHVMRAAPGLAVTLFDGRGCEFSAEVRRVGRTEVELVILKRLEISRELPTPIVLGIALPKGDRQKWLVEKAVELGVSTLVPLRTARGVAQPVQQALERLARTVIEASKQCGRNRLLQLSQPQNWQEFIAADPPAVCRVLAHPPGRQGVTSSGTFPPLSEKDPTSIALAVGPEGGLSGEEVELALAAGWHAVSLGPQTLRTETAAIALTAWAAQRIADRSPAGPPATERVRG
jgi:16S rRNA (uracil1498-N3)-methyltransferase